MIEVVSVTFKDKGKSYYFSPNNIKLNDGDNVIVETERGKQFGTVIGDIKEIKEEKLLNVLKPVLRKASKKDEEQHQRNIEDAIVSCKHDEEKTVKS